MLLITGPLLVLIALAVKIDSRGPTLTKHLQSGVGGSLVPVWKFRCVSLDGATRPPKGYVIKTAPRLTFVGRFLRASSLEDLPQLISVLSGKLSIVGPQPYVPSADTEKPSIFAAVDQCAARQHFRPGIASFSRVNNWCGGAVSAEAMEKRAKDDLYYMNNWSIWLDLWIIFRTIRLILMEPQV
jgi:lipopolysaccharide/colanic/teichoic acid biosynthesis glycosyltransferase